MRCGPEAGSKFSAAANATSFASSEVIDAVRSRLIGWSPWVFAGPQETERRLRHAGFTAIRCWLEERPTYPPDVDAFVRTSILLAHLARLSAERGNSLPPQSS